MNRLDYAACETAVLARLLAVFTSELTADVCKAGDVDVLLENLFVSNNTYACLLEFAGGKEQAQQPMSKNVWTWRIFGVFMIRYSETVETEMRVIVSKLAQLFSGDHTLGGVAPLFKITTIDQPEPTTVNDIPFYWIPFIIEIFDRN